MGNGSTGHHERKVCSRRKLVEKKMRNNKNKMERRTGRRSIHIEATGRADVNYDDDHGYDDTHDEHVLRRLRVLVLPNDVGNEPAEPSEEYRQ